MKNKPEELTHTLLHEKDTGRNLPVTVVLASASPRRKQLMEQAGIAFCVRASKVDETLDAASLSDPPQAAKKLAERKAGAVVQEILAQSVTGITYVLGADTMVVCQGQIFGKPRSLSDARYMLGCLSGSTHEVVTAVSLWLITASERQKVSVGFRSFAELARVTFRPLSNRDITDYLRKGESFDKAGAYAIQGAGAHLVSHIEGERDTVIGLPMKRMLREFPDLLNAQFQRQM